jgi:drug/metabolite transporter (DMT)-like permease
MMTERGKAFAGLVGCALLWSVGGVLIKWVNWHPLAIAGMRSAIAAALFWVVLRPRKFAWSWPMVGGAMAYAATILLYVPAVKLTTAANAILLQYTAPIYVALFGIWFLKEKPSKLDWISIVVTLGGMMLFFREGLASRSFLGDLLAALSGITIAWMTLFLRKQKDARPLESLLLGNVLTALCGLPFMFVGPAPDIKGWAGLLFLGVFQLGLAYLLFGTAVRHVTALEAILVSTLEPILNPVWVVLLIGEVPSPWALAGGALVLTVITARGVLMALKPRGRPGDGAPAEQALAP